MSHGSYRHFSLLGCLVHVIEWRRVQLRINLNELLSNKTFHESVGQGKFFVWKQRIQINT